MRLNTTESDNPYFVNVPARKDVFQEPEARKRGGGPKPMSAADRVARFWSKVKRDGFGCWEWQAGKFRNGYGMFAAGRFNGKADVRYSHRTAYELSTGPIPHGMYVMHACDNKACCNPAHLSLGTQLDNIRDSIAKGRFQITRRRRVA